MRSRAVKGLVALGFLIYSAPTLYDLYKWFELLDKEHSMKQPRFITPDGTIYYPDNYKDRHSHAETPSCYAMERVLKGYSKFGEFKSFNPDRTFTLGPDILAAELQCLAEKIAAIGTLKGNATDAFASKLTKAFTEETQSFTPEQIDLVVRHLQSSIILGQEGKPTGDSAFDLAPRSGHVSVSSTGFFGRGNTQMIIYKNHHYTDKQIGHAVNNFLDTVLRNTELPHHKKKSIRDKKPPRYIKATS